VNGAITGRWSEGAVIPAREVGLAVTLGMPSTITARGAVEGVAIRLYEILPGQVGCWCQRFLDADQVRSAATFAEAIWSSFSA